ncbi:MAG: Fe-S cluster assembly protein SufD [Ignavibacteriae bacterium]|nr:Fe-S cluster assembly protein SufD [Ignavibacteriota bacterium]
MAGELINNILSNFNEFENKLNGSRLSAVHTIRKDAFDKFKILGFPTAKDEEWKYSNPGFVHQYNFKLKLNANDDGITQEIVNKYKFENLDEHLLVFVNGFYSEKLSDVKPKKKQIILGSFADAIERNSIEILKYFGKFAGYIKNGFTALNTAFAQDGAFILIPDGTVIERPIRLLYITDAREQSVLTMPRNLIIAGECSNFKIVESSHTIGAQPSFNNSVSEIVMDFSSNVEYYNIQNNNENSFYVGTTQISQQRGSIFTGTTITLKGNYIRNNLNSLLDAEACETNYNGLYFVADNSFVDNHTLIDHAKPNCNSNEVYKGILNDKATVVFNGKIIVRQDAQKTNAYQTNRNILLTDDAKIHTKPQLEIFADDVKCSHGATSGYLDRDSLFYLRSRGISEEMAKTLLLNAFASEVLEKINIAELRDMVKNYIADKLIKDDVYFCDVLDQIKK